MARAANTAVSRRNAGCSKAAKKLRTAAIQETTRTAFFPPKPVMNSQKLSTLFTA